MSAPNAERFIAAFDVGGTSVKGALVGPGGAVVPGSARSWPARSGDERDALLDRFFRLLQELAALVPAGGVLAGAGYSFPGPFDYDKGVCLLQGLAKYDALYGVCIPDALRARIRACVLPCAFLPELPIRFQNDCTLFALGEWRLSGRPGGHGLYLTLGTGIGSAFLSGGTPVTSGPGVPSGGWVYALPFCGQTVEDAISRRGLLRLSAQSGLTVAEPADLFRLAQGGSEPARQVFRRFGAALAEALSPVAADFQPVRVTLGGQISGAHPFFLPALKAAWREPTPVFTVSVSTPESVFAGIRQLFLIDQ